MSIYKKLALAWKMLSVYKQLAYAHLALFAILSVVVLAIGGYEDSQRDKAKAERLDCIATGFKQAPVESVAVFDIDSVYTYFNKQNTYEVLTSAGVAPIGYCFFKVFADSVLILPESKHCPENIEHEIYTNYPVKDVTYRWFGARDTTVKTQYKVTTLNGTSYSVKEHDTVTNIPRYVCTEELGSILGVPRPINYQELEACEKVVILSSTKDTTINNQPDSVETLDAYPAVLFNTTTKTYALRGRVEGSKDLLTISNFHVVRGTKKDASQWSPDQGALVTSTPVEDMTRQDAA